VKSSAEFLKKKVPRIPMLPDTVHKLPREERFAYAKLLAFVARIDNELTVDEMAMFEQRLGTALLSPNQRDMIRAALKNPPTLEECLDDLHGEAGKLALRDAVLMAAADGNVDEDERDVLEEISEHLGLKEEAVDLLLEWTVKGYKWMKEGYEILNSLEE
jgi:tellurite resistance protein